MVYFKIVIKKKDVLFIKKLENIAEEKHKIKNADFVSLYLFSALIDSYNLYISLRQLPEMTNPERFFVL